ncbi:MAG: hypothetical protein Q4G18_03245 [Myroides sp.]|nr:hypothetical protein [Myroides sp.]
MILNLSHTQFYPLEPSVILIPLHRNWNLKLLGNPGTPVFNFMKNSPTSGWFNYELKAYSAFTTYSLQGYSNLKVRGVIIYPEGDPEWLTVDSEWFPVANYTVENNTQYKPISFIYSPPLSIALGLHVATVKFHIEGTKNGIVEILSTYEIPVVLNVFEEGHFYSPSNFTFNYSTTTPAQNQQLEVGGFDWTVTTPNGLKLIGTGAVQNANGSYSAQGSGTRTFQLGLNTNIVDVLTDETTILPVVVSYPGTSYTVPVSVIQSGDVFPLVTTFSVQSGTVNELFRLIHLQRTDEFELNVPANIDYEILETASGKKIKIYIIDPTAYGNGIFNLILGIIYSDITYNVQVNISVGNQFDLGIDNDTVFTNSMEDLVFTTNQSGSFIDMDLSVVGSPSNYHYRFPFFQGKALKNIGKALSNFSNYNLTELVGSYPLQYFNLNVNEVKNNVTLLSFTKTNQPFLKGFKPILKSQKAILQHNKTSRFGRKSFALVSVFSQTGIFNYKLLKNQQEIQEVQEFGYVKTLKIDFEALNAKAGDVFDFVLLTGDGDIKKTMIIFPETNNEYNIVYVDSFGLHSNLWFSGNTKNITSQLNFKTEDFENKQLLHIRKHIDKEKQTLVLNTGFLLASQSLEIKELIKSPKAWVVFEGIKKIEIIPITEKILEYSADDFLYSYSIEFQINQDKYAQDYNF